MAGSYGPAMLVFRFLAVSSGVERVCFSDDACFSYRSDSAVMLSPDQRYLEEMENEAFSMGENTFPVPWIFN